MRINPNLDLGPAAAELAKMRRLQIKDFLDSGEAERIHEMLATGTPWWLVYNIGDTVERLSPHRLASITGAEMEQILAGAVERAQTEYQFLYASFPMVQNFCNKAEPRMPITSVLEFLNSASTLDWFRRLTGRTDVRWVDAQATLYQSGHFLKSHSDLDDANARVAAYVMNFTRLWERDWGGYLQFFNEDHDIEFALRPIFNALNIFMVPADHSVGVVAPFAYGDRLSVTGWLRNDEPPEAIAAIG